jgi:hypothetical protein
MSPIDIARVCHEVNRALRAAIGEDPLESWELCDIAKRDSTLRGVIFAIKNPLATPEAMHESWRKDKEAQGWIYGPEQGEFTVEIPGEKDAFGVAGESTFTVEKRHPCMVPYSELPRDQRIKDHVFSALVTALKDQ